MLLAESFVGWICVVCVSNERKGEMQEARWARCGRDNLKFGFARLVGADR